VIANATVIRSLYWYLFDPTDPYAGLSGGPKRIGPSETVRISSTISRFARLFSAIINDQLFFKASPSTA